MHCDPVAMTERFVFMKFNVSDKWQENIKANFLTDFPYSSRVKVNTKNIGERAEFVLYISFHVMFVY